MRSGESAAASWLVSLRTCTGRNYRFDKTICQIERPSSGAELGHSVTAALAPGRPPHTRWLEHPMNDDYDWWSRAKRTNDGRRRVEEDIHEATGDDLHGRDP